MIRTTEHGTRESQIRFDFPKLMRANLGIIVLFSSAREGMVIRGGRGFTVGYYSDDWSMDEFNDCESEESFELENSA